MEGDPFFVALSKVEMNGQHFFELAQNAFSNSHAKEEALATYRAIMRDLDTLEEELDARQHSDLKKYVGDEGTPSSLDNLRAEISTLSRQTDVVTNCANMIVQKLD